MGATVRRPASPKTGEANAGIQKDDERKEHKDGREALSREEGDRRQTTRVHVAPKQPKQQTSKLVALSLVLVLVSMIVCALHLLCHT